MSITVMKQALEALEKSVGAMRGLYGGWRCEAPLKAADAAITSLRQAIAEAEKRNWKSHDLYTDADKDRPDAICDSNGSVTLGLCKRCGKGECELSDPCIAEAEKQEPLCTAAMFDEWFLAKSGLDPKTPLYTHPQPKREPVAWEQLYPDIGKPQLEYLPASPFDISGKPQPKREWVNATAWRGLSDDEIDEGLLRSDYALQTAHAWRAGVVFAMTKLKEKNT